MELAFVVIYKETMPWAIGPRMISSCVKKSGFEARMLFVDKVNDKTCSEIALFVKNADLIGLPVMTNTYNDAVKITETIKKETNSIVIWGGVHCTIKPEECIEHADVICIGEGEESVVELLKAMEEKRDYSNISGLWVKQNSSVVKNKIRPLIKNLDALPFADWDFSSQYILDEKDKIQPFCNELFKKYCFYPMQGTYPIITSRGCPFACAYCCNSTFTKMWPDNRKVRKRSIDNIIRELAEAKEQNPLVSCIHIVDDAFMTYPEKEIEYFCREFKSKIGLPFANYGITPDTYTSKKFRNLMDAGMAYVRLGIQTASAHTKKLYNRKTSNKRILEVAQEIHEYIEEIKLLNYDVIIDNPWETEKDMIVSLRFLSRLPVPYFLSLYSLRFFPGTDLYFKAKDEGIIVDEQDEIYARHYQEFNKSYINNLFFLIHNFAYMGRRIPPFLMMCLTNLVLRKTGISKIIYMHMVKRVLSCPDIPKRNKEMLKG